MGDVIVIELVRLWTISHHVFCRIQKWTKCEDQLKSNEYDGLVFLPNKLKSSEGCVMYIMY